jgi:curved DNA-binding protein CbpA
VRGQGVSLGSKNYYKVLGLSTRATQIEIERAYRKKIKEAHFDRSKNRKEIELAYLILTDVAQKAMHDAVIDQYERKLEITAKIKKRKQRKIDRRTLVKIAAGLFIVAVLFFSFRYGYHLKSFSTGDVVYYKSDQRLLGTILEVQNNHSFGKMTKSAYKIRDGRGNFTWVPQDDVKASCYKK